MTAKMNSAIKKRKHLNRKKRSSKENEKDTALTQYTKQKTLVQLTLMYEQRGGFTMRQAASASGPHHLGGPHQNFNVVTKVDFSLRKKSLKVNLL